MFVLFGHKVKRRTLIRSSQWPLSEGGVYWAASEWSVVFEEGKMGKCKDLSDFKKGANCD